AMWNFSVADLAGFNGLSYRTSGDPRTAVVQQNNTTSGTPTRTVYRPLKYHTAATPPTTGSTAVNNAFNGSSPIVLASGIEARLIEAEAALQAQDYATWLGKLNHLRQTAHTTIKPATDPLPALSDPGQDGNGTDAPRVDLLFRERAFWLFLTGHR